MESFKIKNKEIGGTSPVFIIAEMSGNHLQKYENAEKLVVEAAKSGADAIKLQTYTPDTITLNVDNEYFRIKQGTIWDGRTLYDLYKEAYTPWEWQPKLKKVAEDLGLICFSTPFDKTAVDFLEDMNVELYKIASFEITDIPLIEYVAKKGKPIILSTGIAELSDIELALKTIRNIGNNKIALLKCTSAYPAPIEEANLKTISNMMETFDVISGLSDHTEGIVAPITAVALGAKIIEKHMCLDRSLGGPDAKFSLEPEEFREMVNAVRNAEKAIGKVSYELTEKQKSGREFSKSIFVSKDIKKGEIFTKENIKVVRPGYGLHPKYYNYILGKKSLMDIKRGTPMRLDMLKIEGGNL
ncbi:pseudaminic acid synthase [Marinitoga aeolica]|uniref:Pseudaminic acid synthase n=1 Tax=Marinitoga aeolica TaxID=2809031 RepID=A0ABY8PMT4_9BACT|nr:pseudaminic acid synthase [Marinitoga aeolica]WGS63896.1 pseudaminic acid synthase [Marinitoga aeolica]